MGEPRSRKIKHTPGPWRYDTYNNVFAKIEGPGVEGGVAIICSIPDHPSEGTYTPEESTERGWWYSQSEENAFLIAAAPELLAELEHAHDMIKHYLKCGYLPHMSAEEAEQLVRNPDSAIRKARGEAADAH